MSARAGLAALLVVGLAVAPLTAHAESKPECDFVDATDSGNCKDDEPPKHPPTGPVDPANPAPRPVRDPNAKYTQYEYVTTCSGNTRTNANDVMCQGAATACNFVAGAAEGATAFWVWTRLYDPNKPEAAQEPWVRQPGIVCRGGVGDTAPDVPTIAQVIDAVNQGFQRFVVVKGQTSVDPRPRTLINVDTIFSTDKVGPEPLPELNILGYRVNITVKPEQYVWHFGDGAELTTNQPGRPLEKDVTHSYEQAGTVAPSVSIIWSGTYTINGGEPLTVRGTARTDGPPTRLQVMTARSELVSK